MSASARIRRTKTAPRTKLGAKPTTQPSKHLETFPNPHTLAKFVVRFECPEFTALCPKTGQPDFANIVIWYKPRKTCVELKALKLYLWSFREEGAFHEDVTNQIARDIASALDPEWLLVEGDFWVRGGIHTVVHATHGRVPDSLLAARLSRCEYRGY